MQSAVIIATQEMVQVDVEISVLRDDEPAAQVRAIASSYYKVRGASADNGHGST